MPYRVDCTTTGDTTWASNALRFDTVEEATTYAADLYGRWTSLKAARVVEDTVPEREPIVAGTPVVIGSL